GWRLGTNRTIQFRYQVIGIVIGAVLCVVLSDVFMESYKVLKINTFANPTADVGKWQSAMTFKIVGALNDLGKLPPHQMKALAIGLAYGLVTAIIRTLVHKSPRYRAYVEGSLAG